MVAVAVTLEMLNALRYYNGAMGAYLFGLMELQVKPMTTAVTVPQASTSNRSYSSPSLDLATLNCTHMSPHNFTGKPIWIPAYPGSGSTMLGALVQAATGLGGDDFYMHMACQNGPATCKTHWPTISYKRRSEPAKDKERFADRYVVLMRNPRHALPSYFNWHWEVRNRVKSHSKQAPKEDWINWRDDSFEAEIGNWKNLFLQWQKQPYERAMYLQYEFLTNVKTGPHVFGQLAAEMRKTGVHVAPEKDLACLWYSVVKKHKGGKYQRAHTHVPAYTLQQQALFLEMLHSLRQTFQNDTELVEILDGYYEDIRANLTIEQTMMPMNSSVDTDS